MNKNAVSQAYALMDKYLAHQPRQQIIYQLGIIVERLKFVPEPETLLANSDHLQVRSSLNFLFQQDISPAMQQWIDELINQGLTQVLISPLVDDFFQNVQDNLQHQEEIKVVTAIQISSQLQDSLAGQLATRYPSSRVVFETLPSIMGGCLIIDPQGQTHDLSIKSNLGRYTKQYMQQKLQQIKT